jgi:hypothetical protein
VRLSEKTSRPLKSLHGDLFLFSLFLLHSDDLGRPHLMPAYDPCEDISEGKLMGNKSCGVSKQLVYGTGAQLPLSRLRYGDVISSALPRARLSALLPESMHAHLTGRQYTRASAKTTRKTSNTAAEVGEKTHVEKKEEKQVRTEEKREKQEKQEKREKQEEKQVRTDEEQEKQEKQARGDTDEVGEADRVVTLLLVSECLKPLRTGEDLEREYLSSQVHQFHMAEVPDDRVPLFANALALSGGLRACLSNATLVPINPAMKC